MAARRQKIWITRAQPGADATAERVRALGHDAVVAPLLAVQVLPDVEIDLRGVAALAFTSANGVRAFADANGERGLKVFAVGAATAQAARKAGFKSVGLYASATYKFNDAWSATLHGGYDRLVASAANSPITTRLGSVHQGTIGLTVAYSFPVKGF